MLLLFNLYGYRLWFYYLQQHSQQQVAAVIDNNTYEDSQLVTLKVPLSLPYSTSWSDFERYDGSIEIDGQHYSYVKRKLQNDTLILLCLPNTQQNKLTRNQTNFEKLYNSGYSQGNNKTGASLLIIKLLTGEYDDNTSLYQVAYPIIILPEHAVFQGVVYHFYSISAAWQPPDLIG